MARGRAFGTVRKLASGRYQARYSHLGRQIAADNTFSTKADARAWLAVVETDMRPTRSNLAGYRVSSSDRLHHAVDRPGDLLAVHGRRRLVGEPELAMRSTGPRRVE